MLSVGALQLACFFAFANLGMQSLPAGRSSVLAYTAMLWMVPLSLLVGEKVGWRGVAGVLLGLAGIVVLVDPPRFDWSDRRIVGAMPGCCWRASPGRSPSCISRRHRWRLTPLDVLPWQMIGGDDPALDPRAHRSSPRGHLDFGQPRTLDRR